MTWIKTISLSEANQKLLQALESQRSLYPKEYGAPVFKTDDGVAGIVASHSLIPDALYHDFSTFGVLMSPELPLTRRQHEMINHHGVGDEPMLLLNRIARRVSASSESGR